VPVDLHPEITMADLLAGWPAALPAVARRGMACIGCPMARFETLAEAAEAYGFDPGDLLREVASAALAPRRTLRRRNDGGARRVDDPRHRRY